MQPSTTYTNIKTVSLRPFDCIIVKSTYPHQQSDFLLAGTGEILRLWAKLCDAIQRNKVQFYRRHRERDVSLVFPEMQTGSFKKNCATIYLNLCSP